MSEKNKKSRKGVVYSTNPDFNYSYDEETEETTLPPQQQDLRVLLDKKSRKGKRVTLITGFRGKSDDLINLGNMLKIKCGTGGSVKEGEIIIQGDFTERIIKILHDNGYKAKRSGG